MIPPITGARKLSIPLGCEAAQSYSASWVWKWSLADAARRGARSPDHPCGILSSHDLPNAIFWEDLAYDDDRSK